ncbi:hypothetical protein EDC04DRAFT_2683876 [Pisolithus marmoratus]|nr:hypothetical protein EDC04DRAFT_2683876 [Pisolithus marmoratus]
MRFTLLTLLAAPFITAVAGAAVSPNDGGFDGLAKRGGGGYCVKKDDVCNSLNICCLPLVCHYPPASIAGVCGEPIGP